MTPLCRVGALCAADVFSYGILAWELLARKRAYAERLLTMDQVAAAVERSTTFRPPLPKACTSPRQDAPWPIGRLP